VSGLPAATPGARAARSTSARPHVPVRGIVIILLMVAIAAGLGALGGSSPILAIAAAGAVLLAIAMAIRPDVASIVVLGVIYSNAAVIAVQFHGVPAFAAVAVPILLIVPLGYQVIVRRQPLVITSAFPLIVVFFLIQILGTIFSADLPTAYDELVTFIVEGIGLYVLLVNTIRSAETLRWAVWVLLAVGTALGLLSFYQDATKTYTNNYGGFAQMSLAVLNTGDATDAQPRLAGPIGEKNRYAQIMLMLVPLGVFWAFSSKSRLVKLAALGAAAAASFGVALTFSRGAAVGFALVLVIMFALGYIKAYQVGLVAVAAAALLLVFPTYGSRIGSLVDLTTSAASDSSAVTADGAILSRATEGLTALLVFADHPLIGVGPGLFPEYYPLYADQVGIRVLNQDRQAHNLYLHIAAENGILGLAAFLGILGLTLRDLIRVRRLAMTSHPEMAMMATGLMLAIVTYMATGLFLHLSYARYFWLMLALAGAAGHIGLQLVSEDQRVATVAAARTARLRLGGHRRTAPPVATPSA
jgi:O-antigen ligase